MRSKRKQPKQRPGASRGGRPLVAIVGRPNVGKSALFNRLTGQKLAIVQDVPGVTRDRLYADGLAFGREYILIDTGGFDPGSEDPMTQSIASQVRIALDEADVVICLFDGAMDPTPADREALQLLRQSGRPVLYAANKIDNPQRGIEALELYRLGIEHLLPISALHGHGIGDLEEALVEQLPAPKEDSEPSLQELTRVALVGRPNAGKSSLLNRLLGEPRQIVDARPGTTVDSVDALYEGLEEPMVLIDTAGIRRKRSVEEGVEALSVMQAIRALERSDVAILMVDATLGPSEQDTKIAGLCIERGCALVIALNKMDLLDREAQDQAKAKARDVFSFAAWAPFRRVSAKTGRGVNTLMKTARDCAHAHKKRVSTGEVNRFFDEVLAHHPPPTSGGRAVKLYYATQARSAPPTFVLITNHPDRVHFSYKRYVVNQLRERFGFEGTPIRVFYRPRDRRG